MGRFLCGIAAAAAAGAVPAAWSGCSLQTLDIPVKIVDTRPIATLGLNGAQVPMLVDSGAFFSLLTESTAAELNLKTRHMPSGMQIYGYTGAIEARLTRVEKVQLLNGQVPGVEFIVGGNELGHGVKGILGRNFLSTMDAEYDLAHDVVRLVVPSDDCAHANLAYWADGAPVNVIPMKKRWKGDTSISVSALVNGRQVDAEMDTGAEETVLKLGPARRAGISEPDMTPSETVHGAGEGRAKSWTAPLVSFQLGDERIEHNRVMISDADSTEEEMLLGIDYFLSHRIYVARSQDRIYATYNGGPVFGRNLVKEDVAPLGTSSGAPSSSSPASSPAPMDAPRQAMALARRGDAAAAREDFAHAIEAYDRACAMDPGSALLRAGRAHVRLKMLQLAAALMDIEAAVALDPSDDDARSERAELRARTHDRAGALLDLHALEASLPPQAHLRAAMANTYVLLDLPADALRQWELWLPTHQHDASIARILSDRCRARALFDIDLDKALADCRRAVDEDDTEGAYQESLGWIEWRRGNFGQAGENFERSLRLQPKEPWALYGRGLTEYRRGDKAQAEVDLATARALDPEVEQQARRHGLAAD